MTKDAKELLGECTKEYQNPNYKPSLTLEAWRRKMTAMGFEKYLLDNKISKELFNP